MLASAIFELCNNKKISAENAEKVVKLPRKPVVTAIFVLLSSALFSEIQARKIPIKQAPNKFETNIPVENNLFIGLNTTLKKCRRIAPREAPTMT